MSRKRPVTSAAALKSADITASIIEMREAEGLTLAEIATRHGITKQSVCERIKNYRETRNLRLDALLQARIERQADDLREDIARLQRLINTLELLTYSAVVDAEEGKGVDLDVVHQLLAATKSKLGFYEREAKLLGLDAATKTSISGPEGGPVQVAAMVLPLESVTRQEWAQDAAKMGMAGEAAAEALLALPVDDDDGASD